ncbi:hypothetical protein [Chloroflexus sp.]|uniref:hypothetical protein n=1 Tax=Chloroflexus sp. TaxID=1904827 RepID=UPI00257BC714|nr:hypothetical protein [Chloroflexus sp.]
MRKIIVYGFSLFTVLFGFYLGLNGMVFGWLMLFSALTIALLASLNNEQTPTPVKIVIILGALALMFVFLFVIPALLTMMVRASL